MGGGGRPGSGLSEETKKNKKYKILGGNEKKYLYASSMLPPCQGTSASAAPKMPNVGPSAGPRPAPGGPPLRNFRPRGPSVAKLPPPGALRCETSAPGGPPLRRGGCRARRGRAAGSPAG